MASVVFLSMRQGVVRMRTNLLLIYLLIIPNAFVQESAAGKGHRVINGMEVLPHTKPFMAFLHIYKLLGGQIKRFRCGGTIIDEYNVLTAGHCLKDAVKVQVKAGKHNTRLREQGAQAISSEQFTKHEGLYEGKLENRDDIGLIHLPRPFNLASYTVAKIELAQEEPPPGAWVESLGWGYQTWENFSKVLLAIDNRVLDDNNEQLEEHQGLAREKFICTDVSNGKLPCAGDSGGPLVSGEEVVGVASFVRNMCLPTAPACFASVPYYYQWIKSHLRRPADSRDLEDASSERNEQEKVDNDNELDLKYENKLETKSSSPSLIVTIPQIATMTTVETVTGSPDASTSSSKHSIVTSPSLYDLDLGARPATLVLPIQDGLLTTTTESATESSSLQHPKFSRPSRSEEPVTETNVSDAANANPEPSGDVKATTPQQSADVEANTHEQLADDKPPEQFAGVKEDDPEQPADDKPLEHSADAEAKTDEQSAEEKAPEQPADDRAPEQSAEDKTSEQSADAYSKTDEQSADVEADTPEQSANNKTSELSADNKTPEQSADVEADTPEQSDDDENREKFAGDNPPEQSAEQSIEDKTPEQSADAEADAPKQSNEDKNTEQSSDVEADIPEQSADDKTQEQSSDDKTSEQSADDEADTPAQSTGVKAATSEQPHANTGAPSTKSPGVQHANVILPAVGSLLAKNGSLLNSKNSTFYIDTINVFEGKGANLINVTTFH